MRETGLIIGNFSLFLLTGLIFSGFQTTVWFLFFGAFPPPNFWLPLLVYWALYRDLREGVIMIYLTTVILTPLTGMPFGLFLTLNILLFMFSYTFRLKIFWPGATYFMMVCGMASGLLPIIHLILSHIIEINPIIDFGFFDWVMRSLLTSLVALPLYYLAAWFDQLTQKERPTEMGMDEI